MTQTTFAELVKQNRSCRRFDHSCKMDDQTCRQLIELARHTASGANMQPLKYIISTGDTANEAIFDCLGWAAYLKDWKGPVREERPAAYIVITGDTSISKNFWCDHGIAAQTILLGARDKGYAGCIFASINQKKLRQSLEIEDHLEILLVIALGKPVETVCIEDVGPDGSIRYWRDENQVHHVPKRSLDELIYKTW